MSSSINPFWKNQKIKSKRYCSQLDQQKVALDKKHLELVNRKCIIFHQDNTRPHVSLTRQKLLTALNFLILKLKELSGQSSTSMLRLSFKIFLLYGICLTMSLQDSDLSKMYGSFVLLYQGNDSSSVSWNCLERCRKNLSCQSRMFFCNS